MPQPGNSLAWDRFAYAYNNPVRFSDPSGHRPIIEDDEKGNPIVDKDWIPPSPAPHTLPTPYKTIAPKFLSLPVTFNNSIYYGFGHNDQYLEDLQAYGTGISPVRGGHNGIDIGADVGAEVRWTSYTTGIVWGIESPIGANPNVVIKFGDVLINFGHIEKADGLEVNDKIGYGTLLGTVAEPKNNGSLPHLHLEVRIEGEACNLNPVYLFDVKKQEEYFNWFVVDYADKSEVRREWYGYCSWGSKVW